MGVFARCLAPSAALDLDGIADRVSAPLRARYGGEEEDEASDEDVEVEEDEDEDEEEEEEEEEPEDDFEEVRADGTTVPSPVSAAPKKPKKPKAKKKTKKKKKALTCEQMRAKVHTCVSRMWGYTVGSAGRDKWAKKAASYKKKMADKGCKDIPL
jgi:hypothetical protein